MWEIYAYHNTESLAGIFNAIAAIVASGTYLSAIAAVAFCGFVAALIAYMFSPEKLQGWKWIISVVLVYGVLFVPRVTVGVVDKTGGTPVRVVANVPFGMAALGGLTSSIGNSITELFETAFQTLPGPAALPAELSYQQNGLMFGSRLIQETRRASIPDPAVRTDLVNFVGNCTTFDIADGTISPAAFSSSADLWATMAATNPARFSIITTAAGVTTNTCDQVYASIGARLPAQITDLTGKLGLRLNPSLAAVAAQAAVVNQIPQAYIRGQIAAAAATASDLIRQNAMINAINDAGEMGCQKINDPSCMMLATGRAAAVASQNAAWINGAKIAEQALPVVRNVAEAMCYAVFPLIVLLLFLSSGRNTLLMLASTTWRPSMPSSTRPRLPKSVAGSRPLPFRRPRRSTPTPCLRKLWFRTSSSAFRCWPTLWQAGSSTSAARSWVACRVCNLHPSAGMRPPPPPQVTRAWAMCPWINGS
jgi:conjugal transfer mating pair stabilization protein TraG